MYFSVFVALGIATILLSACANAPLYPASPQSIGTLWAQGGDFNLFILTLRKTDGTFRTKAVYRPGRWSPSQRWHEAGSWNIQEGDYVQRVTASTEREAQAKLGKQQRYYILHVEHVPPHVAQPTRSHRWQLRDLEGLPVGAEVTYKEADGSVIYSERKIGTVTDREFDEYPMKAPAYKPPTAYIDPAM